MIQSILQALGQMVSTTDTMFPFPDFPNISLAKMLVGLAILIILIGIFTGEREDSDE